MPKINCGGMAALLTCVAIALAPGSAAASGVYEVHELLFLSGVSDAPPPDDDPHWRKRAIPDDWGVSQPDYGGVGWYRFSMNIDQQPVEPWAVHLSRFWMNAAVVVNGVPLGGNRDLSIPTSDNWNRPLLVIVPPALLHSGVNQIEIGIWAYKGAHGGLFGLEIGPESAVRPAYAVRHFFKVTLNQAFYAASVLMATFIGLLWLRRRHDSVYGWFAFSCMLWSLKILLFLLRDPRIATWIWAWLVNAVNYWIAVATAIMIHRYFGRHPARLEHWMLGYAIGSTVVTPLFGLAHIQGIGVVLDTLAFVLVTYAVTVSAQSAWRSRKSDDVLVASATLTLLALAVHDWLLAAGIVDHQDWYLLHYGAPVLCLVLMWVLTGRFVKAFNESEALSATLAERVKQKRQELEQSYARLNELQRRSAVAEERDRIMRDLHDGLGGQLVSAIALARGTNGSQFAVEQVLREALDDLRMVIDSLEPSEGDLLALLGTLRGRLEPRLAQQGMRFMWQVEDLPSIPDFGPDKALQVLRIVQEAITNALKHSRGRHIMIRTGCEVTVGENRAFVEVADDGLGLNGEAAPGRGLANMRERALRIGADLAVNSDRHGTAIRLWLPAKGTSPSPFHGIAPNAGEIQANTKIGAA